MLESFFTLVLALVASAVAALAVLWGFRIFAGPCALPTAAPAPGESRDPAADPQPPEDPSCSS